MRRIALLFSVLVLLTSSLPAQTTVASITVQDLDATGAVLSMQTYPWDDSECQFLWSDVQTTLASTPVVRNPQNLWFRHPGGTATGNQACRVHLGAQTNALADSAEVRTSRYRFVYGTGQTSDWSADSNQWFKQLITGTPPSTNGLVPEAPIVTP